MRTIWKFPIEMSDLGFRLAPPMEPLCVQVQHGLPCVWAIVDDEAPQVDQRFFVRGTGHRLTGEEGRYVGSFQDLGGRLVFHVFGPVVRTP